MEYSRADSIDDFLVNLVRSGLSTEKQAAELVSRFQLHLKATNRPDTITTFCTFLVAIETLTAWQCQKLRNGQWKGFFLDEFVILDALGPDAEFGYFFARDTKKGDFVRLAITKPKGQDIEYHVIELA